MAKDKQEEQQLDDEDDKPNKEIFLEKEERDPDEAVFAEQAIRHYASDVLDLFRDQVESAMSEMATFVSTQTQKEELDGGQYLETLGSAFLEQAMQIFGGADSPVGRAMFSQLSSSVDQAMRAGQVDSMVQDLSSGLRDAGWNLRDNLDSVLSNEWDQLRDLAYEGSTDFIAALHAYGLPDIDFDGKTLSQPLMDVTQQYLDAIPKEKEESIEQDQVDQFAEQEAKMEEPEMQQVMEEEEEKEVTI